MENDKKLEQDKQAFFYSYATAKYKRDIFSKDGSVEAVGPYPVKERLQDIDLMDYFNPSYGRVKQVNDYILLKPLSALSILHCADIADILNAVGDSFGSDRIQETIKGFLSGPHWLRNDIDPMKIQQVVDYLRSEGFIYAFRSYTTDQILELGWAKLKQQ